MTPIDPHILRQIQKKIDHVRSRAHDQRAQCMTDLKQMLQDERVSGYYAPAIMYALGILAEVG